MQDETQIFRRQKQQQQKNQYSLTQLFEKSLFYFRQYTCSKQMSIHFHMQNIMQTKIN